MFTNKGFTLIELMIVVAIIAALSMLASSFFSENVIKARCTEGRSALLSGSAALEKCKVVYGAYNSANCNTASFVGDTTDGHFNVALASTATTFTLTATGQGVAAPGGNPYCSQITLNHLGVQGGIGSSPW